MNTHREPPLTDRRSHCRTATVCAPIFVAVAALAFSWSECWSAEFQLRNECRPRGPLVRLGDVAEVLASDAEQAAALAAIELFPAPAAGRQRFVRLREVQDLLLLRGVNLVEHRFSGAGQIAVQGAAEPARPAEPRPLAFGPAKKAERQVCDAVVSYLRECDANAGGWNVNLQLDASAARAVSGGSAKISIRGGAAPWVGNQRFELIVDVPDGTHRFPLEARVSTLGSVVAAVRSLPRGAVLRAEDCQLQAASPAQDRSDGFHSLSEVIGLETTRAIGEGKVLDRDSVHAPVVVRRGEVVTVCARSAGIRVRTTARAREDGSLGDLIAVESLSDRKVYTARVCGIQEAEVFARATQAEGAAAAVPARAANEMSVHAQKGNRR